MLTQFMSAKVISPLDLFFAERLLSRTHACNAPDCTAFLAVLMALSRRGHVCIALTAEQLRPLCTEAPQVLTELLELCQRGAECLPSELIAEVNEADAIPLKPVCRRSSHYYLQKNWVFESQVIFHLNRLHASSPVLCCVADAIGGRLNAEQRQAVTLGMCSPVSLITGGPGTGKTYTAAHLVRACIQSQPQELRAQFRVILAAPTGKAASHLEHNLLKLLSDVKIDKLTAGTLHALLKVKSDPLREEAPPALSADLILVDECSMIDAPLFARLCAAVLEGSRLVLIGDPDQLPPVEAGSFFADLVASKAFPTTCLQESLRMESQGILRVAELIQQGDAPGVVSALKEKELLGVEWKELKLNSGTEAQFASLLRTYVEHRFPLPTSHEPDPASFFSMGEQFRILSCMRQGPYGVDAINQLLFQQAVNRCQGICWLAVPLMITRNDEALELSNGDTGWLIKRIDPQQKVRKVAAGEWAYFADSEKGMRKIAALALPAFEYAYCLSVHKSQGSEYQEILLLIPQGSEVFGREVLYTAMTRARRRVYWDGPAHVIEACVQTSSRKCSGMTERFRH